MIPRSLLPIFGILFLFFLGCAKETGGDSQADGSAPNNLANEQFEDHSKAPTPPEGMVYVPGEDAVNAFFMDATEVTNRQFSEFVAATGYVTNAEKPFDWEKEKQALPEGTPRPPDSLLAPGALVFQPTDGPVNLEMHQLWWQWTLGADWRHPTGPESSIDSIMDHPVVQISWADAVAYANWAGKRLPDEAEWELAAFGGHQDHQYPWGNESPESASDRANFWQGEFPYANSEQDGYFLTAPVKSYPANDLGLYDMAGNVWEWCRDLVNDPYEPLAEKHAIKGGSFLCNDVYCSGYRIQGKMSSSVNSGLNHTGFRCVKDIE